MSHSCVTLVFIQNKVAFKIIIELVIDRMVILKATSFLERHKSNT
jgi:hypothetical protein